MKAPEGKEFDINGRLPLPRPLACLSAISRRRSPGTSARASLSASAAARIDPPAHDRSARLDRTAWRSRGGPIVTTWRDHMTDALEQISGLLHEAAETPPRVERRVGAAGDDSAPSDA